MSETEELVRDDAPIAHQKLPGQKLPYLPRIAEGNRSTFLISHHGSLKDGPKLYRKWHDVQDRVTKIELTPGKKTHPMSA